MTDRDPNAPRPRQPSRPDLQAAEVDRTVGGAEHQRRFDAPKRNTLTDLPAARPPAPKPTLSGLPAPPPLPIEHAPTVKVPARSPLKEIWRVPTPPSAVAQARRSDPPTSAELAPVESPHSERAASREAILEGEVTKLRAEKAELKRQARIAAESKAPGPYQVPIVAAPPAPTAESIHPDGSLASLRKAQTRLYIGLAALLAVIAVPLGAWLSAAAEAKAKSETAAVKADNATSTAERADAKASTNTKTQTSLEQQFRQHRANEREVWRLLGVLVPKADGDPEPENLEPMTPYCAPGKVCPGPQLVLRRSP